jgi:enoyl-CoA hydratase
VSNEQTPTHRVGDVLIRAEGPVVTATIDRPQKRNAINFAVIEGIDAAIELTVERQASVLVLRGSGGNFCAGADLEFVRSCIDDVAPLTDFLARLSDVCNRLSDGPFVSVAVVTGYAVAGGCELLVACDLAVCSEDAQIGDRHLQNALLPGAGNSVRLPAAIGPARARRLFYTAEMIPGRQAEAWGLVCGCAPTDQLEDQVSELVERVASRSPAALRAMKEMVVCAETKPIAEALADERRIFLEYAEGSDHVRNALSAFLGRNHRPTSTER